MHSSLTLSWALGSFSNYCMISFSSISSSFKLFLFLFSSVLTAWMSGFLLCCYATLSPRAFFLLFLPCKMMSLRCLLFEGIQPCPLCLLPKHALVYQYSISPRQMLSTLAPASRLNRAFVTTNIYNCLHWCVHHTTVHFFSVPSVLMLQQILVYLLIWILGDQLLFP